MIQYKQLQPGETLDKDWLNALLLSMYQNVNYMSSSQFKVIPVSNVPELVDKDNPILDGNVDFSGPNASIDGVDPSELAKNILIVQSKRDVLTYRIYEESFDCLDPGIGFAETEFVAPDGCDWNSAMISVSVQWDVNCFVSLLYSTTPTQQEIDMTPEANDTPSWLLRFTGNPDQPPRMFTTAGAELTWDAATRWAMPFMYEWNIPSRRDHIRVCDMGYTYRIGLSSYSDTLYVTPKLNFNDYDKDFVKYETELGDPETGLKKAKVFMTVRGLFIRKA